MEFIDKDEKEIEISMMLEKSVLYDYLVKEDPYLWIEIKYNKNMQKALDVK